MVAGINAGNEAPPGFSVVVDDGTLARFGDHVPSGFALVEGAGFVGTTNNVGKDAPFGFSFEAEDGALFRGGNSPVAGIVNGTNNPAPEALAGLPSLIAVALPGMKGRSVVASLGTAGVGSLKLVMTFAPD